MKANKLNRIKEVGKKTVSEFVRSETGSVGVKNAATIGVFAAAFAMSQTPSEGGLVYVNGTWYFAT